MKVEKVSLYFEATKNDEQLLELAKSDKEELIEKQSQLETDLIESLIPRNNFAIYDELELSITPGAGGQEAMLFSKEIFDMYSNYAMFKGWTFQVATYADSDVGKEFFKKQQNPDLLCFTEKHYHKVVYNSQFNTVIV